MMKQLSIDLLQQTVNRSDLGLIVLDEHLSIVLWNEWMAAYTGLPSEQACSSGILEACPELLNSRVHEAIINTLLTNQPAVISNVLNRTPFKLYPPASIKQGNKDISCIQQAVKIVPLTGTDSKRLCMIQISDVSAAVKREKGLEQQVKERRLVEQALDQERALFIAGPTVVFTWPAGDNRIIDYISPNIKQQFGYSAEQFLNGEVHMTDLIHPEDEENRLEEINRQILLSNQIIEQEYRIKNENGDYRWVYNLTTVVRNDNGEISKFLGYLFDITERKLIEEKVEQQAYYDELTGLANRRMFMDRLNRELTRAKRRKYMGALFFIDLDRFKSINDTLGHSVGDLLLKRISKLLQKNLRQDDTAARLGGDEFVIILSDLGHQVDEVTENAMLVAQKIKSTLGEKHIINGNEVHSTPSIGIVTYSGKDKYSADDLIRYADTAMYRAKTAGRNEIRFFSSEMQQQVDNQRQLEKSLRAALDNKEFTLYFQPLFNNKNKIISAEALLRWKHPEKGWISPADFIPLAEETGIILPLGEWVLHEACSQLKKWEQSHQNQSNKAFLLPILAVNVSPKQFRQKNFVSQVKEILQQYDINPTRLEIELTEGIVIADVEDTIQKMNDLKSLGVKIAIDDFGTGYSSLTYLKNLPIDVLKIDQSFVRDITKDKSNSGIVRSIISMATNLGLYVIAEGVETLDELDHLISEQCAIFQGYYFSKPLSADEFGNFYQTTIPTKI
jgi:diguanylate cyclase (GGDEF)-like protein/PAS domain S-box-containing protein